MLGKPNQLQAKLFYNSFCLEQRVHKDHPLRKIENLIDFTFIRSEFENLYGHNGNQSIVREHPLLEALKSKNKGFCKLKNIVNCSSEKHK